jgi:hypothetical protein
MYDLTTKLWCDPHTLERNRLPVRTFFWPYRDEAAALADDRGRALCLSGQWRFRWFPSALMVTEDVICQEPAAGWDDIRVPRSWQFAGYGRFLYTDEAYPFPVDPPFVPAQHETGVYRRAFEVSCAPGERYVLRLDGAESACEVYVNGCSRATRRAAACPRSST